MYGMAQQVRNSNFRADILQHVVDGSGALQSTACGILHPRGIQCLFHHGLRSRGNGQDHRFAPSLLHRTLESVRFSPRARVHSRHLNGGHYDRLSDIADSVARRPSLQDRPDTQAHQGCQGYKEIALRSGRQFAGSLQHRRASSPYNLHLRHYRHVRVRSR